jgi:hypothetical protein
MGKLGINAKAYRNTGSYNAPVWSELTLISDLSVNPAWDEASADARESRIKQVRKTMMGLEVTGRMKKKPLDTNYEAFMNALNSDDVLDLLILDGPRETEGSRGYRFDAQVFGGTEDQAMGNVLYQDFAIKPSLETNPPKAVKVAAGGVLTYAIPGAAGGTFAP